MHSYKSSYKSRVNLSTNYVFAGAAGASRSYTERLQTTILQVFEISGKSKAATLVDAAGSRRKSRAGAFIPQNFLRAARGMD